jgi:hypothetical protein
MNPIASWSEADNRTDAIAGDRRHDRRYDIGLELRWKLIHRRKVLETGVGRTIDLSSGGILFDAGRDLPVGLNVELSVSWPVLLHNVAPLQLVVLGRIVRLEGQHVALRITQYEFRTMASAPDRRESQSRMRSPIPLFGGLTSKPAASRQQ